MDLPSTTFHLIDRFRRGDREAFTALIRKYRLRLSVLIHYKLLPEKRRAEEIEEIVKETFCFAFEDLSRFQYRAPGNFLNWLSRIADHLIVDGRGWKGGRQSPADKRIRDTSQPEGDGQKELEVLLRKFNALPEQYREIILLAKIEGLSTQEMAERLDKSREAIALLLHRAIQRFRAMKDTD